MNTPVAQRMEQTASNRKVEGSNPSGRATFLNRYIRKIYHNGWASAYYSLPTIRSRVPLPQVSFVASLQTVVNITLREQVNGINKIDQ